MKNKEESKNKYLVKNTIIFAIGNFATKLISFLLVPLYTNVLSPEQFGAVDLLYTICSFLIPLFSFNITEAVLRFSLDKNSKPNKIMSIALVSIIFLIISSTIMIPILSLFNNFSDYKLLFYMYMITFGTSQIFLINLKGQEKLKLFSIGNFIYAFSVSILNIIFLLIFKIGIKGYFIAYIIANLITIIYGIIFGNIIETIKKFEFDKILFKNMIKYSLILIPTSFMWWIMNFLDRIMLTNYMSLSANGIYAVSYKIPTVLSVVSSIFTQAWLFSAIKEKDAEDNNVYTNKVFNFMAFGTIIVGSILLIVIKPLFNIYVSKEFFEAWEYVSYLMIGYVFLNLSTFISTSYSVHKDSKGFLYSAIIGAVINCILNLLLIRALGIAGAAIATMISYISVFIYRLFDTKKYLIIKIEKEFVISIVLMIVISVLLYIQNMYTLIIQVVMIILIIYVYRNSWIQVINIIKEKCLKKNKNCYNMH